MPIDQTKILDLSPLGVLLADAEQRIIWCNQRFLDDTQLAKEKIEGQLLAALPMEAIDQQTHIVQMFNDTSTSGTKFHYWKVATDTPTNGTLHYFTLDRDISSKPSTPNVSKLTKRPSWVEFLDYEVSRSRRYDNPLCVLKLHILIENRPDELEEGAIRQAIKDTLLDELRWADMIGNTSRGSFLMVLPETPNSALDKLKLKIKAAVSEQLKALSSAIQHKIVFGSAFWQKHDDSSSLLQRARENLVFELEADLKQTSDPKS